MDYRFSHFIFKGIVKWAEPCYSARFKDTLTQENQPFFKWMEILIFDTVVTHNLLKKPQKNHIQKVFTIF